MQPVSVKDKWHGVKTHMGSWPIYGSRTHYSPEPDESRRSAATFPERPPRAAHFTDAFISPLCRVSVDRNQFDVREHVEAHICVNKKVTDDIAKYNEGGSLVQS